MQLALIGPSTQQVRPIIHVYGFNPGYAGHFNQLHLNHEFNNSIKAATASQT